jgi:hypothetical protein
MTSIDAVPIACTLGADDLKARIAEIAALNDASLREHRRDDLELELMYAPGVRERVHEMIRREQECCTFLTFDLKDDADALRLIIRVPESAREAAEAVFAPFLSKSAADQGSGCCAGEPA